MHVRTQIRDALKTLLTGLATTGANVSKNRVYPYTEGRLPALSIRSGDEVHWEEGDAIGDSEEWRLLTLHVEVRALAGADVDDELDQIAVEIENALSGDSKLGGLLKRSIEYEGADEPSLEDGGKLPIGLMGLHYTAYYVVDFGDPETAK